MNEGYQGTQLDRTGICNHCNTYFKFKKKLNNFPYLHNLFLDILKKHQSNNENYDCVLLFSGGKDSTYVLWELKTKYNLKILAFTYDWGFQNNFAKNNCDRVIKKLDVEHIKFTPRNDFLKNMRKYFYLKRGCAEFCRPCIKEIFSKSFLIAQALKIPIIISAHSRAQVLCEEVGIKWFNNIILYKGSYEKNDLIDLYYEFLVNEPLLKEVLPSELIKESVYRINENIKVPIVLPYFAFHPYNELTVRKTIEKLLGWKCPPESTKLLDHTDCQISQVTEYLYSKTYGVSKRTRELSFLVRDGKLPRAEALNIEENIINMKKPEKQFSLLTNYLNLSKEEEIKSQIHKEKSHYTKNFNNIKLLS